MSLSIDATINVTDPAFLTFLADTNAASLFVEPSAPGAAFEDIAHRPNPDAAQHLVDIDFIVRESWSLTRHGKELANFTIDVPTQQRLEVNVFHALYLRNANEQLKGAAHKLFDQYDPQQDGDLAAWTAKNMPNGLAVQDVVVTSQVRFRKSARTADTRQRDAILATYGAKKGSVRTKIKNQPPYSHYEDFTAFARESDLQLNSLGEKISFEPVSVGSAVSEITAGSIPGAALDQAAPDIIKGVLDAAVPAQCGAFTPRRERIAEVSGLPEFKVEWHAVVIRIGCADVTITLPQLLIRDTQLVLFVYWAEINALDQFIKANAGNCALRAALTPEVAGTAFVAPPAAAVAFVEEFGICMGQAFLTCSDPGAELLKECGSWKPI